MAKGVDDRIVSITFDNAKFEANVKATIASLSTLDAAIRKVGTGSGLDNISKSANKVDFKTLSDAIDKINAKLQFPEGAKGLSDLEAASNKTQLTGVAGALDKIKQKLGFDTKGITDIEGASNRVTLGGISSAIDKVKQKLAGLGSDSSFTAIEGASDRVTLSGLGNAVDSITAKFGFLQVAGVAALGAIVAKASSAGTGLIKSFTTEPLTTGLSEYETKLNAIQTILANTQAAGTNLGDVTKALNELNRYADKTIYNFGQMTKNIGTFTAAGVDLDTATSSIKGIANLAALSGSSAVQASTGMFQLSQAISAGRVSLQDWNSVQTAGFGGAVFQRALTESAIAMGTLDKAQVKFTGNMKNAVINGESFRNSIMAKPGEESWLTKDVLTSTLENFTGDLSDAELAAKGFSEAQIDAMQKQAKTAVDAATKVKTLSGVISTAKEVAGSGWAQTWEIIFGNFTDARKLFTGISNTINGFIDKSAQARNAVLTDWKKLGGQKDLFAGIKNVFEAIGAVLKPIKEAFRDIFPAKTGKDLADLSAKFRDFTEKLKIGPETADNLKRTFRGFFAVLDIGKTVVGNILGVIGKLLGLSVKGSGGFLEFTAKIGDFLVAVRNVITQGDGLKNLFEGIGDALGLPIKLLGSIGSALGSVFGGADSSAGAGAANSFDDLGASMKPLAGIIDGVSAAWEAFVSILGEIGELLQPVFDEFSQFGEKVADAFSNGGFEAVFDVIQTGLIAGIFLAIRNGLKDGIGLDIGAGGVFDSLGDTFKILNTNLTAMQNNIKANTLLQIATAITVLAAGVLILSLINPDKLASAMTATAVGLGQLVGAMALLTKIGGVGAFATMPIIAASLVLLAVAVDILAIAVIALSQLSWEQIAKGLVAVGGALLAISIGTKLMGPQVLLAGAALIPIAVGLTIMAAAMAIFGTMKWEAIGKGIAAIAAGLIVIGIAARAIGPQMLLAGPGLILMAVGLTILSGAILAFGSMDLGKLAQGILGAAVAIVLLGTATGLIPPTLALQAAGLILLGIGLSAVAAAIGLMGGMSVEQMAKGILGLGAALVVLGIGLTAMSGAIPGTIALMGAAVALSVLVPVIGILGNMKWGTIVKGIATIAAVLATIAIVGLVAAPALALVGVALVILGAGVAAIGAGVYLIAKGLVLLGAEGQKGIAVMVTAITAFVALLPRIIIDFVKGLVAIVDGIVKLAPAIVGAFSKILILILDTFIVAAPKAAEAMIALITAMLTVLNSQAGPLITAGWNLIQKLLQGFSQHAGELAAIAGTAVTNLLNGLASRAGAIATAGGNLVISILRGIANQQSRILTAGVNMVINFLRGIANNIGKVATEGTRIATRLISTIASSAGKMINTGTDFIVKMVTGIGNAGRRLVTAGTSAATKFVRAVSSGLVKMIDEGEKAIIDFMNGVANALRENQDELNQAGENLASAIIDGAASFLASQADNLVEKIASPFRRAIKVVDSIIKRKSPSKVFRDIGKSIMDGAQLGVVQNSEGVVTSLGDVAYSLVSIASKIPDDIAASVSKNKSVDKAFGVFTAKIWKRIKQIQGSDPKVFTELGDYIGKEFSKGLRGSEDDIVNSFTSLSEKIGSSIETARQTITDQKGKLKDLLDAKKLNLGSIAKAQAVINQNQLFITRANAARKKLNAQVKKEQKELIEASKAYDDIVEKLKAAQSALDSAKAERDNAIKSYTDQYAAVPDIDTTRKNSLPAYLRDLKARAAAVEKFRTTLEQLRAWGLDDATYRKLLAEGPEAQGFADALVAGGPAAIAEINSIDTRLATSAEALGTSAGTNLYQAGVDTAQGLVDGLTSQEETARLKVEGLATKITETITKALEITKGSSKKFEDIGVFTMQGYIKGLDGKKSAIYKKIKEIAEGMIDQLKKSLDIKSPSGVFAALGKYTSLGMATGISSGAKTVVSAVSDMGDGAVDAMRNSVKNLSGLISNEIDPNPVITPVLDLTDMKRGVKKLGTLSNVIPITAAGSYSQAATIAALQRPATETDVAASTPVKEIKFEQNNYSPTALTEAEIYRQTNNQLSQARKALGLAS